jgi:hypothetical protein
MLALLRLPAARDDIVRLRVSTFHEVKALQ